MATLQTTRRELLLGTAALVVSFSLAPRAARAQAKPVALDQVDSFLAIHRDGTVTMYTGKVDLGTGIRIALPQMVAEELDVAIDKVKLVEGDTTGAFHYWTLPPLVHMDPKDPALPQRWVSLAKEICPAAPGSGINMNMCAPGILERLQAVDAAG